MFEIAYILCFVTTKQKNSLGLKLRWFGSVIFQDSRNSKRIFCIPLFVKEIQVPVGIRFPQNLSYIPKSLKKFYFL